jgi:hypothetical protein
MRHRWLLALLVLLIGLALPLSAQDKAAAPAAQAAERAKAAGVELGTKPAGAAAKAATRCTLTLSPNSASNGTTFSFNVSYTPCLSQPETETFTFRWPSTLAPNFTETTVRTKIFRTSAGCVASSSDSTLVPMAGAIKGSFRATVAVKNTSTNAAICSAAAAMTVP